jgi:outer membrane protein assembly factor BamB
MKKNYTVLVLLFSMSLSFGQTITQVWATPYSLPERVGRSGPAIASDGTVYIGCNFPDASRLTVTPPATTPNNFFAINPDGSLKWQASITEGATFNKVDAIESSPSISADGSVYIGGHFGRRLYKINPADGTFITRDLGARIRYSAAAFATDGTVIQLTRNNGAKGVRSLTPDLTTENWVYPAVPAPAVDFNSTPAIAKDGTIYAVGANNTIYALNPNGTLKWSTTYSAAVGFASSAIALANDGTVYVSAKRNTPVAPDTLPDGIFMALNPTDGAVKWSDTASYVDINIEQGGPAVAADGTVYLGNNGGTMKAYNPATGAVLWTYPPTGSTVSIGGIEVVPAIDNLGRLYFGTTTGNFCVLNSDGTLAYDMLDLGDRIDSSAAIDKDGSIYVGATLGTGANSGKLYKLQTTATGLQTGGWPMYAGNLRHTSNAQDIYLSIVDNNTIDGFNVYPNPVNNGEINISTSSNGNKSVQIFDVLGKQVYSKNILADEKIKTSNLGAGLYILKVEENGKTATRKLIIE